MATATTEPGSPKLPIRRNIALLSGAVAANATMLSLAAAVAAITLDRVLEADGLLGLGPAIVLAAGALAAVPAGRAMDRLDIECRRRRPCTSTRGRLNLETTR